MTKKIYPNDYDCEGCPDWDDVNGCWANCSEWCGWEPESEEDDCGDEDV